MVLVDPFCMANLEYPNDKSISGLLVLHVPQMGKKKVASHLKKKHPTIKIVPILGIHHIHNSIPFMAVGLPHCHFLGWYVSSLAFVILSWDSFKGLFRGLFWDSKKSFCDLLWLFRPGAWAPSASIAPKTTPGQQPRRCMSGTKPVYSPAARMVLTSPRDTLGACRDFT